MFLRGRGIAEKEGDVLGDEGVNLAKVGNNLLNETLNVLVLGDVALVGLDLDTVVLGELLNVLLGTLFARRVGDGNVSSHLCQTTGGLNAHSAGAGGTSDDDDLALEAEQVLEGRRRGNGRHAERFGRRKVSAGYSEELMEDLAHANGTATCVGG